jgi:hypothetical protein
VRGHDLLDRAGRAAMAGDVDDLVGTRHHKA